MQQKNTTSQGHLTTAKKKISHQDTSSENYAAKRYSFIRTSRNDKKARNLLSNLVRIFCSKKHVISSRNLIRAKKKHEISSGYRITAKKHDTPSQHIPSLPFF
jgi:hypothetical protein